MNPFALHCTSSAWSLRAARRALAVRVADEAADRDALLTEASAGLRSPIYGVRRATGGHADPVTTSTVPPAAKCSDRWTQLDANTTKTLAWLADKLNAPAAVNPLDRLQAAIPHLRPRAVRELHLWLAEADQRIRAALNMRPDHWPLAGNPPCPACGHQMLAAQTSAPDSGQWTVVCLTGCQCVGNTCPCGMPVKARGVQHIWKGDQTLTGKPQETGSIITVMVSATEAA